MIFSIFFLFIIFVWGRSLFQLWQTKAARIWFLNIFIFIFLSIVFLFSTTYSAVDPSNGQPWDTRLAKLISQDYALLITVFVAQIWGFILWRYSNARMKKMTVKSSAFEDILDAD